MESLQDAFTLRQRSQAEATPTQVADDSTQPQQDDEIITPIQEEAEKPTSSPQITKANADDDVGITNMLSI